VDRLTQVEVSAGVIRRGDDRCQVSRRTHPTHSVRQLETIIERAIRPEPDHGAHWLVVVGCKRTGHINVPVPVRDGDDTGHRCIEPPRLSCGLWDRPQVWASVPAIRWQAWPVQEFPCRVQRLLFLQWEDLRCVQKQRVQKMGASRAGSKQAKDPVFSSWVDFIAHLPAGIEWNCSPRLNNPKDSKSPTAYAAVPAKEDSIEGRRPRLT